MDFGFTEEQDKFRKELRDFYLNELSENYSPEASPSHGSPHGINEESKSFWMALQKKAGAKSYLTPGWPKEYGGLGFTSIEQGIVQEEEGLLGLAWPNFIGYHLTPISFRNFLSCPAGLFQGIIQEKGIRLRPASVGKIPD